MLDFILYLCNNSFNPHSSLVCICYYSPHSGKLRNKLIEYFAEDVIVKVELCCLVLKVSFLASGSYCLLFITLENIRKKKKKGK